MIDPQKQLFRVYVSGYPTSLILEAVSADEALYLAESYLGRAYSQYRGRKIGVIGIDPIGNPVIVPTQFVPCMEDLGLASCTLPIGHIGDCLVRVRAKE